MGWTAPRFDNGLNGPRWYARPSTTDKRGGSDHASYNCRDQSGKERVPASRLRCDGKGSVAKATRAAAVIRFRRQPAPLPGSDGSVCERSYSVSARLIGQRVRVLVHHDHLEVYFGERLVE